MAENYFMNENTNCHDGPEEKSVAAEQHKQSPEDLSDGAEVWATPRASWRSTLDDYIEAVDIVAAGGTGGTEDGMAGYSKINKATKTRFYDKILTEADPELARSKLLYNSQVTLSYTKVSTVQEMKTDETVN